MESDKQCEEWRTQNQILGVQVADLQEQLKRLRDAEGQHANVVSTKTKEWEVYPSRAKGYTLITAT